MVSPFSYETMDIRSKKGGYGTVYMFFEGEINI
jgi:hypothetical protein